MAENGAEMRSLALTPTWSVASVLTVFVAVSLVVERSIHRLSNWLRKTNRKPLLQAVEKMKEAALTGFLSSELMLLGFISLLLTATSSIISNICVPSKFYDSVFAPCSKSEVDQEIESLEQLHRFIFVMAVTHVSYSCLTMLLAIVKVTFFIAVAVAESIAENSMWISSFLFFFFCFEIHSWRAWEDQAHMDRHDSLVALYFLTTWLHKIVLLIKIFDDFVTLQTCFFRQFGHTVVRADYLTLRKAFISNHKLTSKYDFHSYMIRSMEEEFQKIVGVSGLLWGFVVAFMLFNVKGSNLYFWIAIIPVALVLLVGAKLQHIIATLALESAGITRFSTGAKLKPRDDLFWFKKPQLLLSLIHFILFQWQFGYSSCFIRNHLLVYLRLILGFAGQFLCSYSTLPLYALVTQVEFQYFVYPKILCLLVLLSWMMGTNYKAAIIPQRIRETIHGWGKEARRKRRLGIFTDDSTIHTDTSTVMSLEEDDHQLLDSPQVAAPAADAEIELQCHPIIITTSPFPIANEASSRISTPLLRPCASVSSSVSSRILQQEFTRSSSMPARRE
ncbi:hypothetical protein TEA_000698 [Camellia sinensis var. sinensis]|uniref:MLO-like protein n=1 Tax=Camellia sinensis var. sinensis TaxID=542762 RepID=A0A4S4DWX2_CAMSN|nr:hypothetical protein TEA_000698 [Camellia sinensis var. sinensis]